VKYGSAATIVDAACSSQECSACGYIDARNRDGDVRRLPDPGWSRRQEFPRRRRAASWGDIPGRDRRDPGPREAADSG